MKRVLILGSTGSIGVQALDVVARSDDLQVVIQRVVMSADGWFAADPGVVVIVLVGALCAADPDALQHPPADGTHVYLARAAGEPVGCLLMTDHDGNSDVEAVAVPPEARGRGISGNLLRHALADARERGIETSTLVSTPLGLPVYERLGFRPLGRVSMWEFRPDA